MQTSATLTITIAFGTVAEGCTKLVQDISVYLQKCAGYCKSCPDGGSILQYGTTYCLSTCPTGYFVSPDGTLCLKCSTDCVDCEGTIGNCTLCGVINNLKYYLNDTDILNTTIGGVCVLDCTGAFYKG